MSTDPNLKTKELIDASSSLIDRRPDEPLSSTVERLYAVDPHLGGFLIYLIDKFEQQALPEQDIEQRIVGCAIGLAAVSGSIEAREPTFN